jgi:hypothetical protein
MAMTRLLKASFLGELTILAAVVVGLAGTPERALAQVGCYEGCGNLYEAWADECDAEYLPEDPEGYESCLGTGDTIYEICIQDCFV